ncbi:MAG: hypothetical protein KDK36_11990, partial [Leptospiraceae bacterium]|nr:hypothetical protein [Leptospiraceae bacterium]
MENFELARTLVNERELKEENLSEAKSILHKLNKNNPDPNNFGLLCEIQYLEGELAPQNEKIPIYKEGIEYGKKGIEIDNSHLESNFWLSVNYGLLGDNQGMMNSVFLLEPIETHVTKAVNINESYFFGAPLRVLGYFYHKIPGWPIS